MNPFKVLARQAGNWYIRRVCSAESDSQNFAHHNERPIEYRFALECLARVRPRTVLDVGTGTTSWPHLLRNCGFVVTAIDNVRDYWDRQMVNRHWTVLDVDITKVKEFHGPFDAVTCISVVEHIVDHENAVRNMLRVLAPGGLLIITTPIQPPGAVRERLPTTRCTLRSGSALHLPVPFREGDRTMAAAWSQAQTAGNVAAVQRSCLGDWPSHRLGAGAIGRRAASVGVFRVRESLSRPGARLQKRTTPALVFRPGALLPRLGHGAAFVDGVRKRSATGQSAR